MSSAILHFFQHWHSAAWPNDLGLGSKKRVPKYCVLIIPDIRVCMVKIFWKCANQIKIYNNRNLFIEVRLLSDFRYFLPVAKSYLLYNTLFMIQNINMTGTQSPAIWHYHNPFSQWQCSFQLKTALPLVVSLATASYRWLSARLHHLHC